MRVAPILKSRFFTLLKALVLILPASIGFGALLGGGDLSPASIRVSVGTAMIIAVPIFSFEMFYVMAPWGAAFRRLALVPFLALRLLAWTVWIFLGCLIAHQLVWVDPSPAPLREPDFWWSVGFSFAVSLSVTFLLTISQLLGPGVLWDLVRGRYHHPRTDERAVAFIDLKGSTALAEQIGPERFLEAMGRFVALVSSEARASEGTVYGYAGDGVIVTWEGRATRDLTPAAGALIRLKARVSQGAAAWRRDFGQVPDFRASLHVGPVAAGEIGDDKRAIVFLGDTMNVASRLEQAARDLGHDLVCSVDAARRIGPILGVEMQPLAPISVRGKAEPMVVVALKSLGPAAVA